MSVQGLERLEVWKKSKEFALEIYRKALPQLPVEENWSMNLQIQRSVQGIPVNIAEGNGRFYYQYNVRFCYIARGSPEETLSHQVLAHKLNYIPTNTYELLVKNAKIWFVSSMAT